MICRSSSVLLVGSLLLRKFITKIWVRVKRKKRALSFSLSHSRVIILLVPCGPVSNSTHITCITPRGGVHLCVYMYVRAVVRAGGLVGSACIQQLHVVINEKMEDGRRRGGTKRGRGGRGKTML